MGRFLTPDWSEVPEPVPYADLNDPQTLNLYVYGNNNPLIFTDADGHCPCVSDLADLVDEGYQAGKMMIEEMRRVPPPGSHKTSQGEWRF
jgi:hypothetical protein